ncbi:MAG: hypothetical protein ACXVXC_07580 [Nocardioidaceae bacterium]
MNALAYYLMLDLNRDLARAADCPESRMRYERRVGRRRRRSRR